MITLENNLTINNAFRLHVYTQKAWCANDILQVFYISCVFFGVFRFFKFYVFSASSVCAAANLRDKSFFNKI